MAFDLAGIIPATKQLAQQQDAAWMPTSQYAPLLLGFGSLLLVFGLLQLVKAFTVWFRTSDES